MSLDHYVGASVAESKTPRQADLSGLLQGAFDEISEALDAVEAGDPSARNALKDRLEDSFATQVVLEHQVRGFNTLIERVLAVDSKAITFTVFTKLSEAVQAKVREFCPHLAVIN